jgi:hypothetical protein
VGLKKIFVIAIILALGFNTAKAQLVYGKVFGGRKKAQHEILTSN